MSAVTTAHAGYQVPAATTTTSTPQDQYKALVIRNCTLVIKVIQDMIKNEIAANMRTDLSRGSHPEGTIIRELSCILPSGEVYTCKIRTTLLYSQVVQNSPEPRISRLGQPKTRLFQDTLTLTASQYPLHLTEVMKGAMQGCDPTIARDFKNSPMIRSIVLRVTDAVKLA